MTRSRIRGMFLGIAIGDALGKPVEMWSINKIAERHGRITTYQSCDGHKFFDGHPLGSITDDTILSMAVAEALIRGHSHGQAEDMDEQASGHATALDHAMGGWGDTTREALQKLKDGVHWSESGQSSNPNRGTGNGVAMKVLPYGAYCLKEGRHPMDEFMVDLSLMTHYTKMAVASGAVMAWAAMCALSFKDPTPSPAQRQACVDKFMSAALWAEHSEQRGNPSDELLSTEINKLYDYESLTPEKIVETFGKGKCYIKQSIPFTLAFWLRNPGSIQTVYDLASAGGDTDSNCSMGSGLVGAVCGENVFPKELQNGLTVRDEILDLADRFCDSFNIS